MEEKDKQTNTYDDDNIPQIDLPDNCHKETPEITQPLPESSRPRQDGPGGEGK